MANWATSALSTGQALLTENLQTKGEWRLPDSAALNAATIAEMANPSLAALRTREDRTVSMYFPVRQAAINGTARAAAHTGARGDSNAKTPSWSTFSEPFSISKKQAGNNVLTWAQLYASLKRNAVMNILARADAWFVAALVADKTQVNVGGGNGSFNAVDDIYENPLAEINYFFQNAKDCMWDNLYRGQLVGVLDSKAFSLSQRLRASGSANAVNYGFQLEGINVVGSTRTVLGSTYGGSGVFYEAGQVGIIPWIPTENRKVLSPEEVVDYNGGYGMFTIPQFPGVMFAEHAYSTRADDTGNGGYTQDLVMQFEISIDLAYQSNPLSSFRGANDSVVYGVGQLTA